ncbi:hypothetical protein [Maribacter litoralis]|uniref:hypothetical protein n=1 Tax=Maribacter litoralis TaxID=2059726 RepID=UPI000E31798A|nr:hypothetical protein [Maribacter litoralis]
MFLKDRHKIKYDDLTSTFLKELSVKNETSPKEIIRFESESDEIAEIISKNLLDKIQKTLAL